MSTPPLFAFAPNWAYAITETWSHLTAVSSARDATESRKQARKDPRSFLSYIYTAKDDRDRQKIGAFLARHQSVAVVAPYWPDGRAIKTQAGSVIGVEKLKGREFRVGGYAAIIRKDGISAYYEITAITEGAEADAITLDKSDALTFSAGDMAYPAYDAEIQASIQSTQTTSTVEEYSLSVKYIGRPSIGAGELFFYRDHPVLVEQPNRVNNIPANTLRQLATLDYLTGKRYRFDAPDHPFFGRQNQYLIRTREQLREMMRYLEYMAGRLRGVWMPTFQRDLTLHTSATASAKAITVKRIDYTSSYDGISGRADIVIQSQSGPLYRRITNAVPLDADTESIELDAPLAVELPIGVKISWVEYLRSTTDDIVIDWRTAEVAQITLPLRTILEELIVSFLQQSDVDWRRAVMAATTNNINLASPGATIDGVTMAEGDPFLAHLQDAGAENGIYTWNGAAVAATRRTDANASELMKPGMAGRVMRGSTYGRHVFFLDTLGPIDLGTTALTFDLYDLTDYTGGNGVSITGREISADLGNGLEDDGSGKTRIKRNTNSGLTLSSAGLRVGTGDGLHNPTGTTVGVDLATNPGLEFATGKLRAKAGANISVTSAGINANFTGGDGIDITAGSVAVDLATNSGLEFTSNKLRIGAGDGLSRSGSMLNVGGRHGLTASGSNVDVNAWTVFQTTAAPGSSFPLPSTPVANSMVLWRIAGAGATPAPMVNRTGLSGGVGSPYNTTDYYTVSGLTVTVGAAISGEAMVIGMYLAQ